MTTPTTSAAPSGTSARSCAHILGARLGMCGEVQIVLYVTGSEGRMFEQPGYRRRVEGFLITDRYAFCPRCGKRLSAHMQTTNTLK